MPKSLYITAAQNRAGKALAALGVMDMLASQVGRIGIFRPVVGDIPARDPLVELLLNQYSLNQTYEEACPYTYSDIAHYLEAGQPDKVIAAAVEAFQQLKQRFDFILIVGTDYVSAAAGTELELNAELAANLASPVLLVVSGVEKNVEDVEIATGHATHVLQEHGCSVVATIVNRVDPRIADDIRREINEKSLPGDSPTYVLNEVPVLAALTVGEVATGLHGVVLAGDGPNLQREVERYVAGSGHVPVVLGLLDAGTLLVAAGDRSDLAVAAAAVASAPNMPMPAGVVLTCGVIPDDLTIQLLRSAHLPAIAVTPDTYQTLHTLDQLRGEIRPGNRRKIAAALAEFTSHVDREELSHVIQISSTSVVTPLMFQVSLLERARANKRHIVLPEGTEERILRAADELLHGGICSITLLGDPSEVRARAKSFGLSLGDAEIIDPIHSSHLEEFAAEYAHLRAHKGVTLADALDRMSDASYFGTMLVHMGYADGMVSGATHTTAETIRPALEVIKTTPDVSLVSSTFLMCLPDRVLAFADCAVNPDPTAQQLADIAASTVSTAVAFGIDPRVAMLSYSTGESGSGEDVDKVRLATELLETAFPDLPVAGPIQYDAAVDEGVGRSKMPDNNVAGRATVLIFPDLNSGNTAYKAVQRSSNAVAIGPVLQGLRKPVNDLSRGCTAPDIVNTVAITAIQAQQGQQESQK